LEFCRDSFDCGSSTVEELLTGCSDCDASVGFSLGAIISE